MTRKLQKDQQEKTLDDYINYFYTFDLGCSTALISAGFELVSLDKTNPKKVQFIFRREVGIEKVAGDYWANRLEVKARTFFDNVKMLKNRLYSSK